ncbi:glycosyltransferase family 2 protein [Pseudomonas sp. CCI4.2]|uniref:glycosyltransferase family 2 protein n=1 Tax=Pseudomonas sp. CCI4.2 TaxID=3048620 RepID=UPI002AC8BD3A|nr:glycosyltransferase family 2 protein [Pseudomonas sp. CCI4.2]MEB0091569.1 glycosyltransferase family 2 protein [Pseudomonas sp. CCI4.2]WPX51778.1 glycosyltransferase family 2 protein [Pseudomonas sp. CCI4.2]
MATYNGEQYLEEQIESIRAQDHLNWKLYVSDDGSTDSTLSLIQKYADLDSRVCVVNTQRQGGVVNNFNKALNFSTSDYAMLCDQDDIWLSNKVSVMLASIKERMLVGVIESPILVFSDLHLVDEKNKTIQKSFYRSNNLNPNYNTDAKFLSWRSSVYGCTIIMNRALLVRALPLPKGVPMHDQWLSLIAAHTGIVAYANNQTIRYRQHQGNVVGGAGRGAWGKVKALKGLLKNIEKAVDGCIQQNSALLQYLSAAEAVDHIALDSIRYKLKFIVSNVLPYWSERKGYCFFFVVKLLFCRQNFVSNQQL